MNYIFPNAKEIKSNDKNQVDDKIEWGLSGGFLSFHSSFVCQYHSLLLYFLSLIEITYKSNSLTLKIQMLNSKSVMFVKILFTTANQHLNDKKDNNIDNYSISSLSNPQKVKKLSKV